MPVPPTGGRGGERPPPSRSLRAARTAAAAGTEPAPGRGRGREEAARPRQPSSRAEAGPRARCTDPG